MFVCHNSDEGLVISFVKWYNKEHSHENATVFLALIGIVILIFFSTLVDKLYQVTIINQLKSK